MKYKEMYEIEKDKNEELINMIVNLFHWTSRRYCDDRQSYVTGQFNEYTRRLLAMGVQLNPTGDKTIWAKDAMGRRFDGLTEEEASMGENDASTSDDRNSNI